MGTQRLPISGSIRWAVALALFVAALRLINYLAEQGGGWLPHAASHLSGAAVGGALLVIVLIQYRRSRAQWLELLRPSARVIIAGTALFTLSQLVETLSAVIEYPEAGIIHTVSGLTTVVGMLILVLGLLALLFAMRTRRQISGRTLLLAVLGAAFVLYALIFGFV